MENGDGTDGLRLLGAGGYVPTQERETCSACVRLGNHLLLIDAGTGLQRLVEAPELLDGVEGTSILLTHFHLDHVVGLAYLPAIFGDRLPTLHAPGELLYGESSAAVLERLLSPPLLAASLEQIVERVVELEGSSVEIGGTRVDFREQGLHSHPTLALRMGDRFTYCTDTAFDEGNIEFAKGSKLLFHEAWHTVEEPGDTTHTAAGEAGRVAARAAVESLVLIHINPQKSADALLSSARREFENSSLGEDSRLYPC